MTILKSKLLKNLTISTCALAVALSTMSAAQAKDSFKVAWTIYAGWMPYDYADAVKSAWIDPLHINLNDPFLNLQN